VCVSNTFVVVNIHIIICILINLFAGQQYHGRAPQREVFLSIKHGVEAKNYDDIAKAEKLKPLEVWCDCVVEME
jgi:hypothetical protein